MGDNSVVGLRRLTVQNNQFSTLQANLSGLPNLIELNLYGNMIFRSRTVFIMIDKYMPVLIGTFKTFVGTC